MQNLAAVSNTVCMHVGGPKNFWDDVARTLGLGRVCRLETRRFPHVLPCGVMTNRTFCAICTGVADPLKDVFPNPHICYHTQFARSRLNAVGIYRGPKIREGAVPLVCMVWLIS